MAKQVAFIKIKTRHSLGVRRKAEIVSKYYSREEADNCSLKGTVYPAPVAYSILKDWNKKIKSDENQKH